jgi:hypothetical protein
MFTALAVFNDTCRHFVATSSWAKLPKRGPSPVKLWPSPCLVLRNLCCSSAAHVATLYIRLRLGARRSIHCPLDTRTNTLFIYNMCAVRIMCMRACRKQTSQAVLSRHIQMMGSRITIEEDASITCSRGKYEIFLGQTQTCVFSPTIPQGASPHLTLWGYEARGVTAMVTEY